MMIVHRLGAIVLLLCLGLLSACTQKEKATIVIDNLVVKALPPGRTMTSAYMTLRNQSGQPQTLNYVHSPLAEYIEIHRTSYREGVMQMRPVKRLNLGADETLVLEPGGYHLMIHGVYDPLEVGDTMEITFEFQSGIVLTLMAQVRPPA